jgi:hypothetical protein
MKEGQRLNVLKAEKGQQYRRQNGRQGDSLTGNRGTMKSTHVERARLVEHIVKGAKHKISQQSYYLAPYDLSRQNAIISTKSLAFRQQTQSDVMTVVSRTYVIEYNSAARKEGVLS